MIMHIYYDAEDGFTKPRNSLTEIIQFPMGNRLPSNIIDGKPPTTILNKTFVLTRILKELVFMLPVFTPLSGNLSYSNGVDRKIFVSL